MPDNRQRRHFGLQGTDKGFHLRWRAFSLDEDAVDIVPDKAADPEPARELVDEGPKPDALDDSGDPDRHPHPVSLRPWSANVEDSRTVP
ncbi:hypothetical protein Amsp01_068870 [Amycolatopsis sp. NBRC 101858]|nr:hypothetical protein Amsp01_068870 [Amycolatopsis sp. NBRC 101858]